jgi:predicted permease
MSTSILCNLSISAFKEFDRSLKYFNKVFSKDLISESFAIFGSIISICFSKIVGVAARASTVPASDPPAFWTTFAVSEQHWKGAIPWNPAVDVLGRIKLGVTGPQAQADARAVAAILARERTRPGALPDVRFEGVGDPSQSALIMAATLMMIVGLVVLLACANVVHVLLASAVARRYEIATRVALGAGRARLVRQLLTESVLLGLLAGGAGLTAAWVLTPSIARLVQVPPSFDVSVDRSAVVFVALVAVLAGIVAGLAPARHAWRRDLLTPLRRDQVVDPAGLRRGTLRSLLIGGQAAVSLVLLVMAALLVRSVTQGARLDPGYDVDRLLNVSVVYPPDARPATGAPPDAALMYAALRRVQELPGVSTAALTAVPVFGSGSAPQSVNGRVSHRNDTSAEYFAALGLSVLRGRLYTADEVRAGAPVAVISASLARQFWPDDDPIGDTLERVWGPDAASTAARQGLLRQPAGTRVIGVVSDATVNLGASRPRTVYLPMPEASGAGLVVRAKADARPLLPLVQAAIESLDPTLRVMGMPATDGWQRALEGPRILAALAIVIGAIALALAAIGLFGITAFSVEQRVHELGVRRAIGATSAQLVALLLRDSLRPVVVGMACGLLLSLMTGKLLEGALFGVDRHDPLALAAAVLVLVAASLLAVLVPARRATRVNPAHLLKLG